MGWEASWEDNVALKLVENNILFSGWEYTKTKHSVLAAYWLQIISAICIFVSTQHEHQRPHCAIENRCWALVIRGRAEQSSVKSTFAGKIVQGEVAFEFPDKCSGIVRLRLNIHSALLSLRWNGMDYVRLVWKEKYTDDTYRHAFRHVDMGSPISQTRLLSLTIKLTGRFHGNGSSPVSISRL